MCVHGGEVLLFQGPEFLDLHANSYSYPLPVLAFTPSMSNLPNSQLSLFNHCCYPPTHTHPHPPHPHTSMCACNLQSPFSYLYMRVSQAGHSLNLLQKFFPGENEFSLSLKLTAQNCSSRHRVEPLRLLPSMLECQMILELSKFSLGSHAAEISQVWIPVISKLHNLRAAFLVLWLPPPAFCQHH